MFRNTCIRGKYGIYNMAKSLWIIRWNMSRQIVIQKLIQIEIPVRKGVEVHFEFYLIFPIE
jgi:hypothetical protein